MVTFTNMFTMIDGNRVQIVRFTRETSGKNGKVYDIDIFPDGTERYSVNCQSVDSLPSIPSVKELIATVTGCKQMAMDLLALGDGDSPEHRVAWWTLKKALNNLTPSK